MSIEIYNKKRWWKFLLILGAAFISIFSFIYTNRLVGELKHEEQKKMELWAEANKQLASETTSDKSLTLVLEVIRNNTTVPVIVVDNYDNVVLYRNIQLPKRNPDRTLKHSLDKMKKLYPPFEVKLNEHESHYIYYSNSILLNKLKWFPIVQLLVVFIFMFIAYVAFSTSRKWEQDRVWVGMARETAHQLGTPTTSLLGWVDILKMKKIDAQLVGEMQFDIERLQTITSRFSKIGSKPDLVPENIEEVVSNMVDYLMKRSSKLVSFQLVVEPLHTPFVPLSRSLFEWVIENLCKNAIDAMEGEGKIKVKMQQSKSETIITISDTGKGMSRNAQKSAFKPGFSTKQRGWGLGLTLSQRIVEQYHQGVISIAESVPGKGTTFQIRLPIKSAKKG